METAISFDTQAFKATVRDQWDRSAQGWDDHTPVIRAWLRQATDAMIEMAGIGEGQRVIDIAAGAGDQTLDIAARVGPRGQVLATDLSPDILARAATNARQAGLANVQTLVADGEALPLPAGGFDAAVCRLGLMFFPQPLVGLGEMRRLLRPGGGVCVMAFSGPQANPCVALAMKTALRHAGLPPRDPAQPGSLFSLGVPGLLDDLMRRAGFESVATTRVDAPFHLPSAADYVQFLRTSAGPIQQIVARLDPPAQAAAWADMQAQLHAFDSAGGWSGPNELLLSAGRRGV